MTIRHFLRSCLIALAALITTASPAFAAQTGGPDDDRRVMVMLKLGPEHYRADSEYGSGYGDAMAEKMRLRMARRIARDHHLTLLENWPMQLVGVDCVIMAVNDDRSLEAVAQELSAVPGVAWSQPLNEFQMQSAQPTSYNDRLYQAQPVNMRWHLSSLHRYATGRGVSIAIIDSRIDTAHPDLAGQNVRVQDFVPGNRQAAERHGTGVAGIIAARPNNAMGIAGVAPGAQIMGLRACWERPLGGMTVCDSLSLAKALTFALEHHADVINLSLSGPPDRLLSTLIGIGLSRGATVVAAVDETRAGTSFPASVAGVLPVGDERLSANRTSVYIAPGLDIPTTEPEGKWSLVNGSSFAAAHVSGLAALLRQLSGNHGSGLATVSALGPRGTIDACAAIARVSKLDAGACRLRN